MPPAANVLIIVAALCSAIFWFRHAGVETKSWSASTTKTLSTLLLAGAGIVLGAPWWVILGLTFGALGDFLLSLIGTATFLAGMVAFSLGHGAYVLAFAELARMPFPAAFPIYLAAMVALVLIVSIRIAPHAGALRWPVRAYSVIIAIMALTVAAIPPAPGVATLQLGAALFVISDLIIAIQMFVVTGRLRKKRLGQLLWPLYWGGQALILWGSVVIATAA